MDESSFNTAVAKMFKRLVAAADQADPDLLECDATPDMVTLTVPSSGKKVIINTQRAVRQIWVAGNGEGVHFTADAHEQWLDDKHLGRELVSWVLACVEAAGGPRLAVKTEERK